MVTMNQLDSFVWLVLRMRSLQKEADHPDGIDHARHAELLAVVAQVDEFVNGYVLPEPPIMFAEGGAL